MILKNFQTILASGRSGSGREERSGLGWSWVGAVRVRMVRSPGSVGAPRMGARRVGKGSGPKWGSQGWGPEPRKKWRPNGWRAHKYRTFFPRPLPSSLSEGLPRGFVASGRGHGPPKLPRLGSSGVILCEPRRPQRLPGVHKMIRGSPNAQFVWAVPSSRGHKATRRPSEREKERKWEREMEKRAKIWGVRGTKETTTHWP